MCGHGHHTLGVALYGVHGEREREGLDFGWMKFCQDTPIPFDSHAHAQNLLINPTQSFKRMALTDSQLGTQLTAARTYSYGLDRTVMSFDYLAMLGHALARLGGFAGYTARPWFGKALALRSRLFPSCRGAASPPP